MHSWVLGVKVYDNDRSLLGKIELWGTDLTRAREWESKQPTTPNRTRVFVPYIENKINDLPEPPRLLDSTNIIDIDKGCISFQFIVAQ